MTDSHVVVDHDNDNNDDPDINPSPAHVEEIAQRIHRIVQGKLEPALVSELANTEKKQHKTTLRRLLGHTQHCFTVLLQKQASLRVGLHVLRHVTWPAVWKAVEEVLTRKNAKQHQHKPPSSPAKAVVVATLTTLLHHLFLQLLRLHDGFVLLASGECRHVGDLKGAQAQHQQTQYPSRLPWSTQTYNTNLTYSGTSWDEWNDPHNGLKAQWRQFLVKALSSCPNSNNKAKVFWNRRVRPLTEQLYQDHLDTASLQNDFVDLVQNCIVPQLQTRFVQVKVSLQDKLEELRLSLPSYNHKWRAQRQGKKFQIQDAQGVLPVPPQGSNVKLRDMWLRIMALPEEQRGVAHPQNGLVAANDNNAEDDDEEMGPRKPKPKKRRVIVDSDDDDDEDGNNKEKDKKPTAANAVPTPSSTGLVLKVHEVKNGSKPALKSPSPNVSLNAIKQRMGVNAQDLAQAHDTVVAEHEGMAAQDDEPGAARGPGGTSFAKTREDQEQAEDRVRRYQRQLSALLNPGHRDESLEQVWKAREDLRRALLNAGNVFLSSAQEPLQNTDSFATTTTAQEHQKRIRNLKQAFRYFSQSADQVGWQRRLCKEHNNSIASRSRELFLFEGRAALNCGIAKFELWQEGRHSNPPNPNSWTVKSAGSFFVKSKYSAQQMHESAQSHRRSGNEDEEEALHAVLDEMEGLKLQSMASRWLATTLWHRDRFREALKEFEQSAILVDKEVVVQVFSSLYFESNPDLWEHELELRAECYQSWVTAFDLVSGELQRISANTLQIDLDRASELFDRAQSLLERASQASHLLEERLLVLQNRNMLTEDFMTSKGIQTSLELNEARDEHAKWWGQTKAFLLRSIRCRADHNSQEQDLEHEYDDGNGLMMGFGNDAQEEVPVQPFFNLALGDPVARDRRARQQQQRQDSANHSNGNNIRLYNETNATSDSNNNGGNQQQQEQLPNQPRRYRKWGDELLPQTRDPKTGRMVPLLKYPCVPPPMPPHVLELAKKLGHPLAQ